ncbi:MAG: transposase [Nitrospirae bacterium]|nr:transposase [Nitrospirota bacterium]
MPRIARAISINYPHHILQRGNNNNVVFLEEKDRWVYLYLIKKYSEKWGCQILAYCLMPNHVHLLLKPLHEYSLSKTMQGATLCYSQYANKKYNRSGRLWESRYYSCIVDKENFLWSVVRYIEQNPKRAGLVTEEEDYIYSSAAAHVTGTTDRILDEDIFSDEGRSEYIDFLRSPAGSDELITIRSCTRSGRPFGNELFAKSVSQNLGRDLLARPRGRPRKSPTAPA